MPCIFTVTLDHLKNIIDNNTHIPLNVRTRLVTNTYEGISVTLVVSNDGT